MQYLKAAAAASAAVSSQKTLKAAGEEHKRKISNLRQWLSLQRRSVKLTQEQKDKLERIKYKTVLFSTTSLLLSSTTTTNDDVVAASATSTSAETVPPVVMT
jgi:Spy/CpxP family protein refolding chaperone